MRGGIFSGLAITLGIILLIYLGLAALVSYTFASGFFFVLVSVVLILVILIQKPKGGGLAAAFGGGGGGGGADQAMFGARVGDVMTWITVVLFITFIGLGIALVYSAGTAPAANNANSVQAPQNGAQPPATNGQTPDQPATTPGDAEPTDDNADANADADADAQAPTGEGPTTTIDQTTDRPESPLIEYEDDNNAE